MATMLSLNELRHIFCDVVDASDMHADQLSISILAMEMDDWGMERLLDFVNSFCKCCRFMEISYFNTNDFISKRVIYESVHCVLIRMSIKTTFM
jgi:hypothetical protein